MNKQDLKRNEQTRKKQFMTILLSDESYSNDAADILSSTDPFFTAHEVANFIGIPVQTLRKRLKNPSGQRPRYWQFTTGNSKRIIINSVRFRASFLRGWIQFLQTGQNNP